MKTEQRGRMKNLDLLSDSDRAMAENYHRTITWLCTKLTLVLRQHRKNANRTATNTVAVIVQFENGDMAVNAALLPAIAPLGSSIPGTVSSTVTTLGSSSKETSLPPAPWRYSPGAAKRGFNNSTHFSESGFGSTTVQYRSSVSWKHLSDRSL